MMVSDVSGKTSQVPLAGYRILVIEDEYFLAEDIGSVLRDFGADVVGPAGEVGDATAILDSGEAMDAAVLDVNLKNESIYPFADRLRAQKIPFVFTTGYDRSAIESRFKDVPLWEKPINVAAMAQSLAGLILENARKPVV